MTRMENLEIMGTKIENLIKDLDILCPTNSFYLRNKKTYLREKEKVENAKNTGNMNNLTSRVQRYEYVLGAMKMIRSKF